MKISNAQAHTDKKYEKKEDENKYIRSARNRILHMPMRELNNTRITHYLHLLCIEFQV
uniref:Uncharacterized protein n=1 Tax=Arundo donax TaxID=35708 RepID=A0A0A8Z6B5_ARUDO